MNDRKIKEAVAEALRNKDKIFKLLEYLRPEDIERGILILPDRLINRELRSTIVDRAAPYLTDYQLTSSSTSGGIDGPNGVLFLDLELWIKQLGKLQARYMISISELTFTPTARRMAFSYREDVKSMGNALQSMALKALLGDKTLLMKAAEMTSLPISANRQSAVMDLSRISLPVFLDGINLKYEGAGEDFLRFRFSFQ